MDPKLFGIEGRLRPKGARRLSPGFTLGYDDTPRHALKGLKYRLRLSKETITRDLTQGKSWAMLSRPFGTQGIALGVPWLSARLVIVLCEIGVICGFSSLFRFSV